MNMQMDEQPVVLLPSLATALKSPNKAIILYQIVSWLPAGEFRDGRLWLKADYLRWKETRFPWLSLDAVRRLIRELEKDGYLKMETAHLPHWLTVNYDKLREVW